MNIQQDQKAFENAIARFVGSLFSILALARKYKLRVALASLVVFGGAGDRMRGFPVARIILAPLLGQDTGRVSLRTEMREGFASLRYSDSLQVAGQGAILASVNDLKRVVSHIPGVPERERRERREHQADSAITHEVFGAMPKPKKLYTSLATCTKKGDL